MAWHRNGAWRVAVALVAGGAVLASLALSHAFDHLSGRLLLATLLVQPLNALSIMAAAGRLSFLGRPTVSMWTAAKAQSLAVLVLYLVPTRVSELIKPLYLADRYDIAVSRTLSIVLCERLSDVFIMAVAVTAAALYLANDSLLSSLPYWIGVAAATVIFSVLMILRPQFFARLIAWMPWTRLSGLLHRLLREAAAVLKPRSIPFVLALGAGAWASSYAMTYAFLTLSGSRALGAGDVLVVFLAGTAGLIVAVAPAGLGTFEGAIVLALGLFGYTISEALALAVGLRIATIMPSGIIALRVLAREKTGLRSFVRRMRALLQRSALFQGKGSGGAAG